MELIRTGCPPMCVLGFIPVTAVLRSSCNSQLLSISTTALCTIYVRRRRSLPFRVSALRAPLDLEPGRHSVSVLYSSSHETGRELPPPTRQSSTARHTGPVEEYSLGEANVRVLPRASAERLAHDLLQLLDNSHDCRGREKYSRMVSKVCVCVCAAGLS